MEEGLHISCTLPTQHSDEGEKPVYFSLTVKNFT